jgi:DNA-directed RNA polymerase sigma subunit (sigma70/sigma32)
MKGSAEGNVVLQDGLEQEFPDSGDVSNSAGTFSLRRALYFTFIQTQKEFVSAEQERALAKLIREGNPVTRQQQIVLNLRMVVTIAKRYSDRGLEFVDLVREGNEGLIHALEHFKPEQDLCFSSFVEESICKSIERAIVERCIPASAIKSKPEKLFSFDSVANQR